MGAMFTENDGRKGAAGWAFVVWLFGGGLGLAVVVFIVLKLLGG
jgi:hypothetical protein